MIYRLWRWILAHLGPMPKEPEITKDAQRDPAKSGVIVGFRWWF